MTPAPSENAVVYKRLLTLGPEGNQLLFGIKQARVTPQVFSLARMLLALPGEVVRREALFAIWPKDGERGQPTAENLRPIVHALKDALELLGIDRNRVRAVGRDGSYVYDPVSAPVETPVDAPQVKASSITGHLARVSIGGMLDEYSKVWVWSVRPIETDHPDVVLRNMEAGVNYVFRFGGDDPGRITELLAALLLGARERRGRADPERLKRHAALIQSRLTIELDGRPAPLDYVSLVQGARSEDSGAFTQTEEGIVKFSLPFAADRLRNSLERGIGPSDTFGRFLVSRSIDGLEQLRRLRIQLAEAVRMDPEHESFDGLFGTERAATAKGTQIAFTK